MLAEPLPEGLLVGRIGIGVKQRDRNRTGAALADLSHRFIDRPEVERLENPSFVVDPFAHLETELGRHLGRRLRRKIEAI